MIVGGAKLPVGDHNQPQVSINPPECELPICEWLRGLGRRQDLPLCPGGSFVFKLLCTLHSPSKKRAVGVLPSPTCPAVSSTAPSPRPGSSQRPSPPPLTLSTLTHPCPQAFSVSGPKRQMFFCQFSLQFLCHHHPLVRLCPSLPSPISCAHDLPHMSSDPFRPERVRANDAAQESVENGPRSIPSPSYPVVKYPVYTSWTLTRW